MAGVAKGSKRPEWDDVPMPPAPAFGDSIGAITIAGAIMGALFHRERTGEATVVDVSLFATGLWSMGAAMALSLVLGMPWAAPSVSATGNPLTRNYKTSDGGRSRADCLQPGQYWPPMCDAVGCPELKDDERFADVASLMANSGEAIAILNEVFASATVAEWRERLESFSGQWCVVQDTLEAAVDPQAIANGYLQDCVTAGGTPFQLVAVPMQYDGEAAKPTRRRRSTSTATRSSSRSASTWTRSSTSSSATSSRKSVGRARSGSPKRSGPDSPPERWQTPRSRFRSRSGTDRRGPSAACRPGG